MFIEDNNNKIDRIYQSDSEILDMKSLFKYYNQCCKIIINVR